MSRLKVDDLSFFETELSSESQVHGAIAVGLTVNSPTSSVSTFAASDSSSDSNVVHSFNPATGQYRYTINYGYKYAVAGAAAGATSNGPTYATAYASATAS